MNQAWKDGWKLMRIPFSVFLMPVFWLSLFALPKEEIRFWPCFIVFFILHFLIYPASNGYNSLIDKDEGPIGGLAKPPKTNVQLQILVFVFDLFGLTFAFIHDIFFGYCVAIYWMMSKAYSHPVTRLKKFPIISWFVVALFQGGWTVLMVWMGILQPEHREIVLPNAVWVVIASFFLAGSYPITQVYQHEEDGKRGDFTLSILLGIRGTFIFAGVFVALGSILLVWQLFEKKSWIDLGVVLACTFPSLFYFNSWTIKCWKNPEEANFENTMRFNKISSIGLSLGFFLLVCLKIWGNSLLLHR
jgi:4-hydroxybenzoate polyprenyltransferase